jgi:nicotinate-nucleotide adenylyltransferase
MTIGLYFGSFNPIHIGHLIIAQTILEEAKLKEVWFVVSPHNPHKSASDLLHEFDRLEMVERAISDNSAFRASDVEFHLPRPSYTIDTLDKLKESHPDKSFSLIMGSDNLENFHKWKDYEVILENYSILVYPRPGTRNSLFIDHRHVTSVIAPLLDISASELRRRIRLSRSTRYLLPEGLDAFIALKRYYL